MNKELALGGLLILAWAVWSGGGEAHFHQVPEEHLPVLRAADHVCVTLAQAAVQLILLVLMARVPGGEWSQNVG